MRLPAFTRAEIEALRGLRERFLASRETTAAYWQSRAELALYDRTFAERIGWKWDAVLRELRARGWHPASTTLVDWGCGSGVAGRRVLAAWPGRFDALALHDLSPAAVDFAKAAAADAFPSVSLIPAIPPGACLLVSHVLNELDEPQLTALLALVQQAREVIWVESGTHPNSRRLVAEVRERLLGSGEWAIVAPCPHRACCGMFAPTNDRHWCHFFAEPPREIFQDAGWMQLGRTLGIDLRAAPYAFLVLEKRTPTADSGAARVIGRPREYKGYSKLLSCEAAGVFERVLQKRDAPALLRQVQSAEGAPLYRWQLAEGKIVGGEPA